MCFPVYVQVPHTTANQLHHNLPATRGGLGHPGALVDLAFLGGHVCLACPSHPWHPEIFCYNQVRPIRPPLPPADGTQTAGWHSALATHCSLLLLLLLQALLKTPLQRILLKDQSERMKVKKKH